MRILCKRKKMENKIVDDQTSTILRAAPKPQAEASDRTCSVPQLKSCLFSYVLSVTVPVDVCFGKKCTKKNVGAIRHLVGEK